MQHANLSKSKQAEPFVCLQSYEMFLQEQERSTNTIEKYLRDVRRFLLFVSQQNQHTGNDGTKSIMCGEKSNLHTKEHDDAILIDESRVPKVTVDECTCSNTLSNATISKYISMLQQDKAQPNPKIVTLAFKNELIEHYAPTSVNSMLAAVNHFLLWLGRQDCCVKPLKIQRETFCHSEQELTEREYQKLLATAQESRQYKLSLLLQTICATGIRVSELSQITVEASNKMQVTVSCKGKRRLVFLPKKLCERLKQFCRVEHITSGAIFRTRTGKEIDRSNIWKMMQRLCKKAGVPIKKGFPHNLRHLFARTFYKQEKDIARLSDLLGHSNVNTTRIYLMETGKKHAQQVNRLDLLYQENHVTTQRTCQSSKKTVTT